MGIAKFLKRDDRANAGARAADLAVNLASELASVRDLDLAPSLALDRDLARARDLAHGLARARAVDRVRSLDRVRDLAFDRARALDLDRALVRARSRVRALYRDLGHLRGFADARALARALDRVLDLVLVLVHERDGDVRLNPDRALESLLAHGNLVDAANNFIGADLSTVNLAEFDLVGVRWDSNTRWPTPEARAAIHRASDEEPPGSGVFIVRPEQRHTFADRGSPTPVP